MNKHLANFQKRNFYNSADAKKAFFFAVLAPNVLALILAFIIIKAGIEDYSSNPLLLVIMSVVSQVAFISVFCIYNSRYQIKAFKASRLSFDISRRNFFLAAGMGVLCIFGFNYLIDFVIQAITSLGYVPSESMLPLDNIWWYFANIFLVAILPAICEELIFRGIILNGLLSKYKPVTAVVFSALLFAVMHGNLEQFIFPFLMGLVLGYIFYKTGSIFYTMITHFINNCIAIAINYIYIATGAVPSEMPIGMTFVIGMQLALITVLVICMTDKLWKPRKEKFRVRQENEDQTGNELLWIGVGICVFFIISGIFI